MKRSKTRATAFFFQMFCMAALALFAGGAIRASASGQEAARSIKVGKTEQAFRKFFLEGEGGAQRKLKLFGFDPDGAPVLVAGGAIYVVKDGGPMQVDMENFSTDWTDLAVYQNEKWFIFRNELFLAIGDEDFERQEAPDLGELQCALKDSLGILWLGGSKGLARRIPGGDWEMVVASEDGLVSDDVRDIFQDPAGVIWFATSAGLSAWFPEGRWRPFTGRKGGLPVEDLTAVAAKNGEVWVGSNMGAARLHKGQWEYYEGRRWLPDDRVVSVGFVKPDEVWIATENGAARLEFRQMTLEEKAAYFTERLQSRHVRHGQVCECYRQVEDEEAECVQYTCDNDGLWSSMYVAAECFRYAATGDEEARWNARATLEALMRMESITPMPGFPARSFATMEEDAPSRGGEWHAAEGENEGWQWKGDTSSDEVDGHYYAYSIYYDLVADETEKAAIRKVVGRITDHIIDNGYNLIDLDGKPTRWARWGLDFFKGVGVFQRSLNSLEILSHLRAAHHITGNERYLSEYKKLADEWGYKNLAEAPKYLYPVYRHSDDELAFLAIYNILKYEDDPAYRKHYLKGLEEMWSVIKKEKNPLYNFIYASAKTGNDFYPEDAVRTLVEIPMDARYWGGKNSRRADRRRFRVGGIPAEERPHYLFSRRNTRTMKWNGSPYGLDFGDSPLEEDDGGFWLLPYWMGRYYGYIVEEGAGG